MLYAVVCPHIGFTVPHDVHLCATAAYAFGSVQRRPAPHQALQACVALMR